MGNAFGSAVWSATIFFMCFGAILPLSVVDKVQMGEQNGYISNAWQVLTNLTTSATLFLLPAHWCSLPVMVATYSGIPVLIKLMNSATYFRNRRDIQPSLYRPDWTSARHLLLTGVSFVALQCCVAIGYTCDSLILAHHSGPIAVAEYNVVQRLFSLTIIAELSIAPLWGAFGEALARGDIAWARNAFRRSLLVNGTICVAVCLVLVTVGQQLISFWTKSAVRTTWTLLGAFALWRVFNILQGNLSVLLNQEKTLSRQTCFFVAAAIASFGLKTPLLRVFGPPGLIFATLVSFSLALRTTGFTNGAGIIDSSATGTRRCLR